MQTAAVLGRLLASLLLLAPLGACEKDDDAKASVAVSYAQTYCLDRWGGAVTPDELVATATSYLQQRGIGLTDARAAAERPAEPCNACSCKSGVILRAKAREQDVPALQALGFERQ
ncbi:hypothetical protein [Hymenobacter latericus]|uniref:hypothetical protein n=1 Tax=Hymenobacter sp. YIM 151858-1 TaxID=2987688 RepID=UPI002227396B|nr:hypothetical protein [Hymenobacter sp. YIM 151858-1]UYZ58970.1 hypothetical protein OIS50_18155 [Hymenobacter sp. YIM 151858-1]